MRALIFVPDSFLIGTIEDSAQRGHNSLGLFFWDDILAASLACNLAECKVDRRITGVLADLKRTGPLTIVV